MCFYGGTIPAFKFHKIGARQEAETHLEQPILFEPRRFQLNGGVRFAQIKCSDCDHPRRSVIDMFYNMSI